MEWYESTRRLRLLFQVENIYYRFYWFEFKNNNLFWGSSAKRHFSSDVHTLNVSPDRLSSIISVNPDMIYKEIKTSKFSYHESGKIHIKEKEQNDNENYCYKSQWLKPTDINTPKLFFATISKPLRNYDIYNQNLLKNKTFAMILRYDKRFINSRCIFEFYLSPEGKFKTNDFLIKTTSNEQLKTFSLNKDLILGFRNQMMSPDSEMNSWHPDKEITIFPDDLN